VALDGADGYVQLPSDLTVGAPSRDQLEQFQFALREQGWRLCCRGLLRFLGRKSRQQPGDISRSNSPLEGLVEQHAHALTLIQKYMHVTFRLCQLQGLCQKIQGLGVIV
jgi:hypothetical protein